MNCGIAKLRDCGILFDGQALVAVENSLTITVANFAIPHFRNLAIPFWWTWHDLNVRPRPSQSRALIPLSYRSERNCEIAEFYMALRFQL